jgi:hypothetical protein
VPKIMDVEKNRARAKQRRRVAAVVLAVLTLPIAPAAQAWEPTAPVELVVPENRGVPVVLVVQVVLENPAVPAELIVQVEAVPVQNHRPALLAVALRTKSVIAAHHPDQVPLLAVEEDLAAAVAETTREPAAAEVVIAWEAADTVAAAAAAVTEPAAVVEDAAVAAEDVAVAAEDAEDNDVDE